MFDFSIAISSHLKPRFDCIHETGTSTSSKLTTQIDYKCKANYTLFSHNIYIIHIYIQHRIELRLMLSMGAKGTNQ